MPDTCITNATTFRLVDDAAHDTVRELIQEHMDGYRVSLEFLEPCPDGDRYVLEMEVTEVGHSFSHRVESLISAMTPHVLDAFSVVVREDSMSDDRDQTLFGGPSLAAIEVFRTECAVKEAKDSLRDVDARSAMLQALLNDPDLAGLVQQPVPKVFATVEGGVLQSVASTHDLDFTLIDHDIEGCNREQLTLVPQAAGAASKVGGLAQVVKMPVEVAPKRCADLELLAVGEDRSKAEGFLGFSADGYWNNDQGWVESAADATVFDEMHVPGLRSLIGYGVSVLKVDLLMRGTLPIVDDLIWRAEVFLDGLSASPTEEDKAAWLQSLKGEFPLLNEDPGAFAPAVLALLAREQDERRRPAQRPA